MAKYAGYRKRIATKGRTYRRKSMSKPRSKPNSKFVKMVEKVIHKDVEDKIAFRSSGNSLIFFNSGVTSASDIQTVLPLVQNGYNGYQRVGDELRAKRLNIKGYLSLGNDTSTSFGKKRVGVRMMIVSPKRFPNTDDAYANFSNWAGTLLKKGTIVSAFNGDIADLMAPINRDEITVYYDRVHYLSQDNIYQYVNTTNVGGQQNQNIRNTIKFFNIKIPLRNKLLRYDTVASSGTLPTNFGPMLLLGYCHLDGSAADVVDTQVGLQYDTYFSFEDA